MKLSSGFTLCKLAGRWVVVPIGDPDADIRCVITLNDSAAVLWKELEKGVEDTAALASALITEYDISYETALRDCEEFTDTLNENGMLEQQ